MLDKQSILQMSTDLFPETVNHRRHIHTFPELSFKEFKTAEYIKKELISMGIECHSCTETGVTALIGEKSNNCVALRADIDALPIFEENDIEFKSQNDGIMHACGHDMHVAMLLSAAKILKQNESSLSGCVKLIFQPAEESIPGGASLMIKAGVLENPKPKYIFGQHINPGESAGVISSAPGPVMASGDELYWTISGKGSHAAQPHLGNDPILAAANMILMLQSMINKNRNPLNPGVLSVTSVHGGSATNIFPESVELKGTLRTFNQEWREEMHQLLIKQSKAVCQLYGCDCDLTIKKGYPPLINDDETAAFIKNVALELVSEKYTKDFEAKMWAEDFAYFAQNVPSVFWYLGVRPENIEEMPPLHNSKLNPDEKALIHGTAMLVFAAVKALEL